MIPLTLSLRNFLSYRDNVPTLYLEGVHVACLCGPNGHGKSALLDAMTWALWGQARGGRQEQLIHHGQQEMQVDLEFLAREQRYRVIRRYARTGRSRQGTTSLELQMASGNGFRPITGNSVRETEAKILQLLNMDYNTFVNSAFLLQGRADAFTNPPPGISGGRHRKEVLAKVLGLSLYDRLEERAKARVREHQTEARSQEVVLERLRQQVEQKGETQRSLTEMEEELAQVAGRVEVKGREVEELRLRVEQLYQQRKEQDQLEHRIFAAREELEQLRSQMATREERISQGEGVLQRQEEIRQGYQSLQEARRNYDGLNQALQRHNAITQRMAPLRRETAEAEGRLVAQIRGLEERMAQELEPRARAAPELERELAHARERLERVATLESSLQEVRARFQHLLAEAEGLRSLNHRLEGEGRELSSKLELLRHGPSEGARCPLCDSELGHHGLERLAETYQRDIEERRSKYREHQHSLQQSEIEERRLESEVGRLEQEAAREQREAQAQTITLEKELETSRQAAQQLTQVKAKVQEMEHQLAQGLYAPEALAALAELQREQASLGYDEEEHRQIQGRLKELEPWDAHQRRLEEVERSLPQERQSLEHDRALAQRRQREVQEGEQRLKEIQVEVQALSQFEPQLQQQQREQDQLIQSQQGLLRRHGELQGHLRQIEEWERELQERELRVQALHKETGVYADLATAFGKGGVQALLIEAAIPRLEEEANRLLGRMTEHRMTLRLETQRERGTDPRGDFIETLDVLIADELGTRSYEMFSGGEAFRINLALRIALSKLLAWRSGAPLPTLFIDEGFGTQDASGQERILDVIKAIEEDFQRIIVITHLQEVKEAFTVRIEVTKTEAGSAFEIT